MADSAQAVEIREGTVEDADALAALSGQLGYPSTPAQIAARFAALANHPRWTVYVAVSGSDVIGSVFVTEILSIQRDSCAEIGGLIVNADHRNRRVGEMLVAAAEAWAKAQGLLLMIVHSNVIRHDAHRFYHRLGYTIVKAQQYFEKELLPDGGHDTGPTV